MKKGYDAIQRLWDALDETRRARPRPRLPGRIEVYLNDRILLRPLLALDRLARVSEFLLARSYAGLTVGSDDLIVGHYERVHSEIRDLLESCNPAALRRSRTQEIRGVAKDLLERTRLIVRRLPLGGAEAGSAPKGNADCPFCHGEGMSPDHRRLFKYALLKMIDAGRLPESFKVFA